TWAPSGRPSGPGPAAILLRDGPRPLGWIASSEPAAGWAQQAREAARALGIAPSSGAAARPESLSGPPALSAVCTTCADAEATVRCVTSLLAGAPAGLEVLVVDNRPAGSPVRAALEAAFGADRRVRYLAEPKRGLSAARNAGLRAAQGELVAFVDDDVVVDEHWLGALRETFAGDPEADAVTGPIAPLELETAAQVLVEQFGAFNKGFTRRRISRADSAGIPLFPYAAGHFGSGANMAFRAAALRELGGFDVSLGAGTVARGGEDLDVCVRLIAEGRTLVYEPSALVWHRHPDALAAVRRQAFGYGIGLGAMLAKHVLFGAERLHVLRLVPRGIHYLLDSGSRKNAGKEPGFPRTLTALERAGMLLGPLAYVISRLRACRSDATAPPRSAAPVRRVWSGELEWAAPSLPAGPLAAGDGELFDHARLLVRVHGEPVGFVTVALTGGRLDAAGARAAAWAALRERIEPALNAATLAADPAEAPSVTVVVCTRARPAALDRCLSRLRQLPGRDLELLVVDNAPADAATRHVVERHMAHDPRLRYVVEPRPGLSRARNRGLAAARGELIAFTDDDVRVDRMWLAGLRRGFARRGDVACVTGLVASVSLERPAERLFDARVWWSSSCRPELYDLAAAGSARRLHPFAAGRFGTGANMAFRTGALRALGGFDEALGAGSPAGGGEDLDIFVRVLLAGHALSYEPAALVWHEHRVEPAELERQMYSYGKGLAAYLCKYLLAPATGRELASRILPGARHLWRVFSRGGAAGEKAELSAVLRRAELRGLLAGGAAYLAGARTQSPARRRELRP
ncbi:MAG TPA: glycosyltransferase, partial [Gaiellaceae bacterium]|nr:glycosyltransferase [Gaiellaceae bacterium]